MQEAGIRTFLIADVRGYTRFTREHGDEKAAALAANFASQVREVVKARDGEVVELRGDEALSAFVSARQALRAAVDLQARFAGQAGEEPEFPLGIGVGLDAGEAVPLEGGYRGVALNTASRLCAAAGPGQILATETVANLASRLEGIRVLPARPLRLKGFDRPLRVHEVVREPEADEEPSRGRPGRRWALLALAAVLLAGAVAAAVVLLRGNDNAAATGHHAQGGGGGLVSKADDPATIVMGTSIGPVALGTSKDAVRAKLGAPESTTDWGPAKGKSGDNAFYFPNDHRLRISYYNDEVVQITTYDSYYKTPQGVGVGVTFPTPPGLNQSPPPGLSPIGPGCYEWRGIVNGLGVADWYVTGNDAVTRFDTPISAAGGYRIVDVTMTKKEFFEPLIESETGGNYKIKLSDLRC